MTCINHLQISTTSPHRSHARSTLKDDQSVKIVRQLISASENFDTNTMKEFVNSNLSLYEFKKRKGIPPN